MKSNAAALVLVMFAACQQGTGEMEIRAAGSASQEIQGGTFDGTSSNVVAIVMMAPGGGVGICSGSLIAPNLVLTARHCVADSSSTQCSSPFGTTFAASSFRITTSGTAAEMTLNAQQWPTVNNTTWFGASLVSLPATNSICGNDMALIRLSANVGGVCPLIPRVDSAVAANEAYTAVGFGRLGPNGQTSGTRYTVSGLNVLCEDNCGAGTDATEWVGGSSAARGVCQGDSGGPALDSQRRVIGTVSRGDASSCNQALYESVLGQGAWIKSIAAQAATAGGYTAGDWVTGGSTSINPCMASNDGGTGGGAGGGAAGGAGGGAGGGGGSTGSCNVGTICVDATGQGDLLCLTPGNEVPASAPSCASAACPSGFSCWETGASIFECIQDCGSTPVGGGAGGGGGVGGGAGGGVGGGGGSSGGACTNSATTCVDASGMGGYACIATNSTTGIPAGAQSCSQTVACPTNYRCWGTANGNFCLQNCTPGATGGGAGGGGGPVGGGAGGGSPVGGGAGGGSVVGGGAGGGGSPVGGGSAGGSPVGGGSAGGSPVGGGSAGGSAGGTGGSGGAGGAGGGGIIFPGLPEKPKPTGCGCASLPDGGALVWLALSGLALVRRRRS